MLNLSDHPHRRYNPLTDEWIIVSPHRAKRPWQGEVADLPPDERPAFDPACYLCPGNTRVSGITNPVYETTYVFDNDFMALLPDTPPDEPDDHPLFKAQGEPGICRVICFHPRHDLTLAQMDAAAIRPVVDTWAEQTLDLGRRDIIGYVQVFENKGEMMGCSNPHPHGQIWSTLRLPREVAKEDAAQRAYFNAHGTTLLAQYLAEEQRRQERIIYANEHWTALVPFWAVWPFETMLVSNRVVQSIHQLDDAGRDALADAIRHVTVRYDNVFRTSFPYSMGFHQQPTDGVAFGKAGGPEYPYWHLHAHFYPPLLRSATVKKHMVGYEMLGTPQRDITAEQAAARIREQSDIHYTQPQRGRIMSVRETVLEQFETRFEGRPTLLARAPGRVNLIGEHTDYNDGFVLPAAIDRAIYVAARPRSDSTVKLVSVDFSQQATFTYGQLRGRTMPAWTRYPRGALWWLREQGHKLPGFDAVIGGDIPLASGLSSSAAVEVVMLELGLALVGAEMAQVDKALAGVEVEHKFIGMPCGVMDQMASAMGIAGHALMIDTRSRAVTPVPMPQGVSVVIMNTKKSRGLVDSEYATRRKQCEEAAAKLGVKALRDATPEQVKDARVRLGDVLYRRAKHIVSENLRVQTVVMALKQGLLKTVGQALQDSHRSLRDDYEVSCRELDVMSEIANAQPGCYGARMTGAGFGGCAVALVEEGAVEAFVAAVGPAYEAQIGIAPELYVCQAAAGSGVERL